MPQAGHAGRKSGEPCRRLDQPRPLPQGGDGNEDWETDPNYVRDDRRWQDQWPEAEISTTTIISELSKSIQDCSLGKSSLRNKKDYANHHHSCIQDCEDLARNRGGVVTHAHRAPLCPRVHSSPDLGIERSSVFNRNAAETLDTFFSEKLKAWSSDTAQLSDSYENMDVVPEASASHPPKIAEKGGGKRRSRPKTHSRAVQTRGEGAECTCSCRDNCAPDTYYGQCPRQRHHHPLGKGEAAAGPLWRQEDSSPSTAVGSSARILPQCRVIHIQSCRACQEFNQEQPAGQEALYENGWMPLCQEDQGGRTSAHHKGRKGSSSQQQLPDRLSKVQQWLEQTPVQEPPLQNREATHLACTEAPGWCPVYGPLDQKTGDPCGRIRPGGARNHQRCLKHPTESRPGRQASRDGKPSHQPGAQILTCDTTGASPDACSCQVCGPQRHHIHLAWGKRPSKKGTDPSAKEVAAQLQAENRVPRIVEAFERRSLREAKMAAWEKAFQTTRQRGAEPGARAVQSHGATRQGQPPQGATKARKSRSKEEQGEEPRARLVEEEHQKRSRGKGKVEVEVGVGKRTSFMERLRGMY